MLWVVDLSLVLLNTFFEVMFNLKKIKLHSWINNETQRVPLICFSSRFMTNCIFYSRWIVTWKNTIKPRFVIKILSNLDIAFLCMFLYLFPALLTSFSEVLWWKVMLITEETRLLNSLHQGKNQRCYQWSSHRCHHSLKKFIFFKFHILLSQCFSCTIN